MPICVKCRLSVPETNISRLLKHTCYDCCYAGSHGVKHRLCDSNQRCYVNVFEAVGKDELPEGMELPAIHWKIYDPSNKFDPEGYSSLPVAELEKSLVNVIASLNRGRVRRTTLPAREIKHAQ